MDHKCIDVVDDMLKSPPDVFDRSLEYAQRNVLIGGIREAIRHTGELRDQAGEIAAAKRLLRFYIAQLETMIKRLSQEGKAEGVSE